jgi:hypothetical protein
VSGRTRLAGSRRRAVMRYSRLARRFRCGPAVAPSGRRRPQTLSGGPHRRGLWWGRHAAPAWPCPPAWWVGRSPATRPRAVTPGGPPEDAPARGDQHPARIGDRQGPQLHLLAQARRSPSMHPTNLRLALPGVPRPRPAVLQPRRPAVPGARHRADGGRAGPVVVGQGDGQAPHCAGRGMAMALTAGRRRRGEQLGWRHAVMDLLPGPADPTPVATGGPRPAPGGALVRPDLTGGPANSPRYGPARRGALRCLGAGR